VHAAAIDTLRTTETPEGVEVGLRLAGAPVRFAAWLADTLLRTAALVPISLLLGVFGSAGNGLFLIVAFLAEWFYPVVCEVYWNGQTPGKRLFDLKVVRDDGAAVDLAASTLRNLLRFADFLPAGFLFGFLTVLWTDESKRLGDLAAGTVVIHVSQSAHRVTEAPVGPTSPSRRRSSTSPSGPRNGARTARSSWRMRWPASRGSAASPASASCRPSRCGSSGGADASRPLRGGSPSAVDGDGGPAGPARGGP
jgi:uncharacterized RDD family membrane protein YckC